MHAYVIMLVLIIHACLCYNVGADSTCMFML